MIPTDAVVYVPEDIECDDGLYARQGIAHGERRGYRIAGVLRKAEQVLRLAADGAVVVVAQLAHARNLNGAECEVVGEETCRLIPIIQEAGVSRPNSPWDESPTIAFLDRFRHNGRMPINGQLDDGGFAERFLRDRARRS